MAKVGFKRERIRKLLSPRSRFFIFSILLPVALLGAFIVLMINHSGEAKSNIISAKFADSTSTTSTSQSSTTQTTLPQKSGFNSYNSSTYGFGFYVQSSQGGNNYAIKNLSSDKVVIYNTKDQSTPVYMQVFQKATGDTIQQAIAKAVLTGYNSQDCPISVGNFTSLTSLPSNIQTAQMNYNTTNKPSYGAGIGDISKCPHQYTVDESFPIFMTNSNHPNLLYFFFNGQIAIAGDTDNKGNLLPWSDAFILENETR